MESSTVEVWIAVGFPDEETGVTFELDQERRIFMEFRKSPRFSTTELLARLTDAAEAYQIRINHC